MAENQQNERNYAHLPDELLVRILDHTPETVAKMNRMFNIQEEPINNAIKALREMGKTAKLSATEYSRSVIAADGGNILEKMTGSDLLLAVAVGVEGLTEDTATSWGAEKNQYYQWQTVMSHNEANARLIQGVMFLMELSVLASAEYEIRIMDGAHFASIIKINSMLSAGEENAGEEYADALKDFLRTTYNKIIPDIPDIIHAAFNNDNIIALAKYSSSRDVLDSILRSHNITVDDKTFFSLALAQDEYLTPLSVGQSEEEKLSIWDDLRIKCNLNISEQNILNEALKRSINPLRTKDAFSGRRKESELFFTYYKPYTDGPAYKIELKKTLANDAPRLEKYLLSLKKQIIFPEIIEPFPQYLADLMAKGISSGMFAIKEAIRLSKDLKIDKGKFNLLMNYRT